MLTGAEDVRRVHPNAGCEVGKFLQVQPDTDSAALRAAIANPAIAPLVVFEAMREYGFRFGSSSLYRHRHLKCQCASAGLA
jgi:FtsZ-interacting cell division protein ZipA